MTWTKSEKVASREVTCSDCGLPSAPGLDPFVRGPKGLRHEQCPTKEEAEILDKWITESRRRARDAMERRRKTTFTRKWSVV